MAGKLSHAELRLQAIVAHQKRSISNNIQRLHAGCDQLVLKSELQALATSFTNEASGSYERRGDMHQE
jgi:hypothetical protein